MWDPAHIERACVSFFSEDGGVQSQGCWSIGCFHDAAGLTTTTTEQLFELHIAFRNNSPTSPQHPDVILVLFPWDLVELLLSSTFTPLCLH